MDELTETVLIAMMAAVIVLLVVLLARGRGKKDDFSGLRTEIIGQFNLLSRMVLDTVDRTAAGNTAGVELLRQTVEERLKEIQRSVGVKLDETLKTGLDSSFRRVSDQLQEVYKSIGEMRTLTNGIGDLKNILSNVKTRGIWGEVQLSKLLSDFMSPGQYGENVRIEGENVVEYAIRIPREDEQAMLLPIDAKFPMDRYARVLRLAEQGDTPALRTAQKELAAAVIAEAKKIGEKYIRPPKTTDFAVMFLPSEGLYAEVIRLELIEQLQSKWRVMAAGPSTLCALLQSFQMGFKSVAIQKHSTAILDMLNAVKAEFSGFLAELQKTQHSLAAAQGHLETVHRRSSRIQSRLTNVDEIGRQS